jgi:hypothetical protein
VEESLIFIGVDCDKGGAVCARSGVGMEAERGCRHSDELVADDAGGIDCEHCEVLSGGAMGG